MENLNKISIKGARSNNLKNIDVEIPLNKITCIAGPSGSGKSSLAYHTLYSESKRRFLNSLSNSDKFFWDTPKTVDVDSISPVLPVWGLSQNNPIMASRHVASDVLNVTSLFQYVFHVLGEHYCLQCNCPLEKFKISTEISNHYSKIKLDEKDVVYLLVNYSDYFDHFSGQHPVRGFSEEGKIANFEMGMDLVELKRFRYKNIGEIDSYLSEFDQKFSKIYSFCEKEKKPKTFSVNDELVCQKCSDKFIAISDVKELDPGSPIGACLNCEGHGGTLEIDYRKIVRDYSLSIREGAIHLLNYKHFESFQAPLFKELKANGFDIDCPFFELDDRVWEVIEKPAGRYPGIFSLFDYLESKKYKKSVRIYLHGFKSEFNCSECDGTRLKKPALSKTIPYGRKKINLKEVYLSRIEDLIPIFKQIVTEHEKSKVYGQLIQLMNHLEMANDLGLGHLLLKRKAKTLSGSEYQRLLLVKYFGHQSSGGFYILDEPSLGLSEPYQKIILKYLEKLKGLDNTILLVEHSNFFQKNCDELILMGPGSGSKGGEVVYQGCPSKNKTPVKDIVTDKWNHLKSNEVMKFKKISGPYLKERSFEVKKNILTWVHGNPGSGKTSYFIHGMANALQYYYEGKQFYNTEIEVQKMENIDDFEGVYFIDANLGKITSRSTVGTYVGLLPLVRKIFSSTKEAKLHGYLDGHFSWNSPLGQCPSCEGAGVKVIDLHFLEDLEFVCDVCDGRKIKQGPSEVRVGPFSYYDVVSRELTDVIGSLDLTSKGKRIYEYLVLLKLNYLSLGRSLNSLSGGERQRLKLFTLLQKDIKNSIIFFENVSFGISTQEIFNFSFVFEKLRNEGNTIILIDSAEEFKEMCDEEIIV